MMDRNNHHTNAGDNLNGAELHVRMEKCALPLAGSSTSLFIGRGRAG